MNLQPALDPWLILSAYADEFIALAQETGIDGARLLQQLPAPRQLLTGRQVPVCDKKYRNTCRVLFHLNDAREGGQWPLFQFHTFKHGGITRVFNGLRLWRSGLRCEPLATTRQLGHAKAVVQPDDNWRQQKVLNLAAAFFGAKPLQLDHPWLQTRLAHLANPLLLARLDARQQKDGSILLPLGHPQHGRVGFHLISPSANHDEKRHYIQTSGWLTGASITIEALPSASHAPTAICEGVATGLSVALFWPGNVVIALSANNLAAVRATLNEPVCFIADNDQWKPAVGNVGISSALQAAKEGDRVIWPRFAQYLHTRQPTDFNDLLLLAGKDETLRQLLALRDIR